MLRTYMIWGTGLLVLLLTACSNFGTRTAEVTVEVNDIGYQPTAVEIAAGKATQLNLKNVGTVEHQLGITEIPLAVRGGDVVEHNMAGMNGEMAPETEQLQVHLVALPGATTSLQLTPTKTGEYVFRCVASGHTEQGTLVVTR